MAKANSLDTQTAANGGALGCNYTQAQVEQALSVQSVTVGQPIAPVQDPSSGEWIIYEVTSQTVAPLSAASTVARRELLQSTSNVNRVSKEIVAFARTSNVSVDPQYGTWKGSPSCRRRHPPPSTCWARCRDRPPRLATTSGSSRRGVHRHRTPSPPRRGPEVRSTAARIDVVGLGPAGPELITADALRLMAEAPTLFFRTRRHPSAGLHPGAPSFDHHYEAADTFDEVYRAIVEDLVARPARRRRRACLCRPRLAHGGRGHGGPAAPSTRQWSAARSRSSCIRPCPSSTWPSTGWASTR